MNQIVHSPEALIRLAKDFAWVVKAKLNNDKKPIIIYLIGELGAGKTTFCKGFLSGFNYQGLVKSPTYTLVEPYDLGAVQIYHFDLYRLNHPFDATDMGIQDYFHEQSISLIEWPEKAEGFLPEEDWRINIDFEENHLHRAINIKNIKHEN